MIYKFKSKAAGDVIMLGANGDRVLELIGKDRTPQGIIEPQQRAPAIAALTAAVAADDAARAAPDQADAAAGKPEGISLRQRAWPLVEMMKRALAENEPIVWG
jgi:CheY-like chemotaxis protein